jgi:hypothetical protein
MRPLPFVLASLFVPTIALADDAGTPVTPWIVTGAETGIVKIATIGETSLGTVAGWKCKALLSTEAGVDSLLVSCAKGDLRVRASSKHKDGAALGDPVALQIVSADETKVFRTILFGPS